MPEGVTMSTTTVAIPELPVYTHQPQPYSGPAVEDVMRWRKTHLTPALVTCYKILDVLEVAMRELRGIRVPSSLFTVQRLCASPQELNREL